MEKNYRQFILSINTRLFVEKLLTLSDLSINTPVFVDKTGCGGRFDKLNDRPKPCPASVRACCCSGPRACRGAGADATAAELVEAPRGGCVTGASTLSDRSQLLRRRNISPEGLAGGEFCLYLYVYIRLEYRPFYSEDAAISGSDYVSDWNSVGCRIFGELRHCFGRSCGARLGSPPAD